MRQLHLFCAIEIHPEMQIFLYYMLNSKKRAAGRSYIFPSATRFALSCYIYFNVPITNRSFVKNCDQLTNRGSHRRKFLLIFRHDIAFHHVFLMMQVKGMRKQLPAFTLIYFLQ